MVTMTTTLMILFLTVSPLSMVTGHGNMVHPPVWMDLGDPIGCGVLDLPHTEYEDENNGKKPDCLIFWYSNDMKISGEPTISEELSQLDICTGSNRKKNHPWFAPGT